MNTLFQATAKFVEVDDNGKEAKVTRNYLLPAINFMDGEIRISKELTEFVKGEFMISKMSKSAIQDVIESEGERYYKGTVRFVLLDDNTGKSKRIKQPVLVMADSVKDAEAKIAVAFENTTLGADIVGVQESNITEVFGEEAPEAICGDPDSDAEFLMKL